MMIKKIVAFELQKSVCKLPVVRTYDLRDQNLAIVVSDPSGNSTKKLECPYVSFPVSLCTFPLKRTNKKGVRIWKRHHHEMNLTQLT